MRVPLLSDLDREQERIYVDAPLDGVILVTGPPGSGKTIMAWHRAKTLTDEGIPIQLTMYTKVLSKYVETSNEDTSMAVKHLDSWVWKWWRLAGRGRIPQREIEGQWFKPVDWEKIQSSVLEESDVSKLKRLNWGHLIIDEGQDFSKEMYLAFWVIRTIFEQKGISAGLTVFADDNQKIHQVDQSTTKEIAGILVPGEWNTPVTDRKRLFRLRKNYRNTMQIHNFSWYFAVFEEEDGVEPDSPIRQGSLPEVRLFESDQDFIQFVKRICLARPGQEIGVVVPSYRGKRRIKQLFNKLELWLNDTPYKVQAYYNQNKRHDSYDARFDDDSLDFDHGNRVTILFDITVKGLEFDIVILADMESITISDDGAEEAAKKLFVSSSRARNELYICCVADEQTLPPIVGFLPSPSKMLCKYVPQELYDRLTSRVQHVSVPKRTYRGAQ